MKFCQATTVAPSSGLQANNFAGVLVFARKQTSVASSLARNQKQTSWLAWHLFKAKAGLILYEVLIYMATQLIGDRCMRIKFIWVTGGYDSNIAPAQAEWMRAKLLSLFPRLNFNWPKIFYCCRDCCKTNTMQTLEYCVAATIKQQQQLGSNHKFAPRRSLCESR